VPVNLSVQKIVSFRFVVRTSSTYSQQVSRLFIFTCSHSDTHQTHTPYGRTPLDEGSARRRDLYMTTQTQETNIHAPGGIRTRNPSKRSAADLRLKTARPLGSVQKEVRAEFPC
jgi:hypothetical protein